METTKFARYFYENNGDTGKRICCDFEDLYLHAEGRNHSTLVGPTATTGNSIVCGAAVLVAVDPGQFGKEDIFTVARGHILEMKRGPDF